MEKTRVLSPEDWEWIEQAAQAAGPFGEVTFKLHEGRLATVDAHGRRRVPKPVVTPLVPCRSLG